MFGCGPTARGPRPQGAAISTALGRPLCKPQPQPPPPAPICATENRAPVATEAPLGVDFCAQARRNWASGLCTAFRGAIRLPRGPRRVHGAHFGDPFWTSGDPGGDFWRHFWTSGKPFRQIFGPAPAQPQQRTEMKNEVPSSVERENSELHNPSQTPLTVGPQPSSPPAALSGHSSSLLLSSSSSGLKWSLGVQGVHAVSISWRLGSDTA